MDIDQIFQFNETIYIAGTPYPLMLHGDQYEGVFNYFDTKKYPKFHSLDFEVINNLSKEEFINFIKSAHILPIEIINQLQKEGQKLVNELNNIKNFYEEGDKQMEETNLRMKELESELKQTKTQNEKLNRSNQQYGQKLKQQENDIKELNSKVKNLRDELQNNKKSILNIEEENESKFNQRLEIIRYIIRLIYKFYEKLDQTPPNISSSSTHNSMYQYEMSKFNEIDLLLTNLMVKCIDMYQMNKLN